MRTTTGSRSIVASIALLLAACSGLVGKGGGPAEPPRTSADLHRGRAEYSARFTGAACTQLINALTAYRNGYGQYPSSLSDSLYLKLLRPGDDRREVPRDGWDRPFQYERVPDGYHLFSSGPDTIAQTADDLTCVDLAGAIG